MYELHGHHKLRTDARKIKRNESNISLKEFSQTTVEEIKEDRNRTAKATRKTVNKKAINTYLSIVTLSIK